MERLIAIQQQLQVGKNNEGDGGRFKYRTAEQIIERVKPLLKEQGLAVILSDSIQEIGGRVFVVSTATLWNKEGRYLETTGCAELDKHLNKYDKQSMSNEQCTGSASSYARKYALCGLFAIDNGEADPDSIETLEGKIAKCKNADDLNALIPFMKDATEDEIKAFNAQAKNLGIVYDTNANKFVSQSK